MKSRVILLFTIFLIAISISASNLIAYNWEAVEITGKSPEERFMHKMVFDQKSEKIYLTGGMDYPFSPMKSDVWSFDPKSKKWEEITPTGFIPSNYSDRAYAYIPSERAIYCWADNSLDDKHKMFVYSIEKKSWSKITPVGELPTSAAFRVMTHDPMNNRLLLFGGYFWTQEKSGILNDTFSWDFKKKEWKRLKTKGITPPRLKSAMAFQDLDNSRMIVFGGVNPEKPNSDIFAFNFMNNSWEKIDAKGDIPPGGERYYGIYDPKGKKLIAVGEKKDPKEPTYGLYVFDFASKKWENIKMEKRVIRKFHECGAVYSPKEHRMYVYGGFYRVPYKTMFYLELTPQKEKTK